jgi:hypothetical protein
MYKIWILLLQVHLWIISAFHVVIGVGLNLSPEFIPVVGKWYGAERVDVTDQLLVLVRPIGAFMFILGVLAAVAAVRPLRYRAVIYSFAGLFFIRALQRLVWGREQTAAFGIPPERVTGSMVFFFVMAVALVVLCRYVEIRSRAAETVPSGGQP